MKFSRQKLHQLSRDRSALIKTASIIGLVSVVAGLIISISTAGLGDAAFFPLDETGLPEDLAIELEHLKTPSTNVLAYYIRNSKNSAGLNGYIDAAAKSSPAEKKLLRTLIRGLHGNDAEKNAARSQLEKAIAENGDSTPRFTHEFLADILAKQNKLAAAIEHYRAEVAHFPNANFSKTRVLQLLDQEKKHDELRELYKTKAYGGDATYIERRDIALKLRDFGYLFKLTLERDYLHPRWWAVSLSLFSASIWFIIVAQFEGFDRRLIARFLISVLLGVFSASLTLFVVILQEHILGFSLENASTPMDEAIYWIAGVGLREETCKLLCFIPMAFFLRKNHDDLTAFICASMVGLGFAFQENFSYFGHAPSFEPWGRFLTANFFHVALTGLLGVYFFRMIRRRGRGWENFLSDFLLVVFAHGAFDAVISMPILNELGGLASIIILALLAYRYFDIADSLHRPNWSRTISPLAIFVLGAALLIGIVFIAVSVGNTFQAAFAGYLMSLSGMIPIAFIFINRFRNA